MKTKHLTVDDAPASMSAGLRRLVVEQNYRATDSDVEILARDYLAAASQANAVSGTYLRVLAATAQAELREAKPAVDGHAEKAAAQARAVAAVHKRFYPIIVRVCTTPDIAKAPNLRPEEKTRRAMERNRRTNFARSAYSTLRVWVRVGHDLLSLNVGKLTKRFLIAGLPPARPSRLTTARLADSSERAAQKLAHFIKRLAARDREQARHAVAGAIDAFNAALGLRGRARLVMLNRPHSVIEHHAA